IIFDFLGAVELLSIDLIDINGGNNVLLTLTDGGGDRRIYDVPDMWTFDVTVGGNGYDTLMLNTLLDQPGEGPGGDATVTLNEVNFDPTDVVKLEVAFLGSPTSGGLDNLTFIPEPSTAVLLALGLAGIGAARRRRT
ncbi:MAG: PEP-CTERM sorting domain-containing protein, partial [Planctomycetota bacterium]